MLAEEEISVDIVILESDGIGDLGINRLFIFRNNVPTSWVPNLESIEGANEE